MTDHLKPLPLNACPPQPDAILFDWDGTLIDSAHSVQSYYHHLSDIFDMPVFSREQVGQFMRKSAKDLFPEIFGDKAEVAQKEFYAYVERHHLSHLKVMDGGDDFIKFLSSLSVTCGVVSNKRHDILIKEINCLGWESLFQFNIGAGVASRDKPAPDSLVLAAEMMSLDPATSSIWYVGDSETDMQAAISASMIPVFIEHGMRSLQDCYEINVFPYSVKCFQDLTRMVVK